jgi:hypothetical protein
MKQLVNLFRSAQRKNKTSRQQRNSSHRRLQSESLEKRQLLAGDIAANLPAYNYLIAEDVNRDYDVTPLDALLIINHLSRNSGNQNLEGLERGTFDKFYDVSADNQITPLDALRVINRLSRGEAVGELIELRVNPRTADDLAFDASDFNAATRTLTVGVNEIFNLEIQYQDLRNEFGGDFGAFGVYTDIVTSQPNVLEPVLTETQFFAVSANVRQATSGTLLFSLEDDPTDTVSIAASAFAANPTNAVTTALTGLGFTSSQFSVTRLAGGSTDPIEFKIRFTDQALADQDIPDLVVTSSGTPVVVTSTNESIEPRNTDGSIRSEAVRHNINFISRTYKNANPDNGGGTAFFGFGDSGVGGFSASTGFAAVGATGPILLGGVPENGNADPLVEPFDAFSIPVRIKQAVSNFQVSLDTTGATATLNLLYEADDPVLDEMVLINLTNDPAVADDGFGLLRINAVAGTNTAPTISNIADRTVNQGVSTGAVAFTVADAETAVGSLTVTGTSSNTTLVPNANIVFGGSGANRTVTVTPAAGQIGTATITVTVSDGSLSSTDTFVLTVSATGNTAPTISDIANRTVTQGTSTGAIAFTVGDAETAPASLTVTGTSSNQTLVPNANVVIGGSGANRTITVTPAAGQVGTATITVSVSDGTLTTTDTFVLTVNAVANTAPTITNIVDQTTVSGTATTAIAFTVGDAQTAPANLVVTGSSSNPTLVPTANIVFGGSGANRTVTITPAAGQVGTSTITVSVSDGSLTATDTFVLTVTAPANTAPTISNVTDRTVTTGTSTGAIAFTIGDAQTAPANLTVTGTSSNTTLVPNANIVFGGSGANRTVTVTPASGQVGTATITISVSDGSLTATDTFVLTVSAAANTAPTISNLADRSVVVGTSTGAIAFTIGDSQTAPANLTVTGTSSNTTLVPNANIVLGGSGANRTVTVTPAAGQIGTATITVTVSDGSLTTSDTFVLTVTPPANTAPTISNIGNVTINEDEATSAIAFTISDSQTAAANLVVTGSSSNTSLVPNANIVFGGSGVNRTVTVTPVANRSGSATITISVSDGSLSSSDTFVLTVNSVNDAPTGAAVTRTITSGATYTFSAADFPLTDALDNPANTLAAVVISSLPNAAQGTLRLNGTAVTVNQVINVGQLPQLTFASVNGFEGQGSFTFRVRDNGGGDNGGISTDPTARTFTFNINRFQPSTISGKIFTDFIESLANPIRNGVQDAGEDAIGGLSIQLTSPANSNLSNTAINRTVVTNGDGEYSFTNVVPGTYTVTFLAPSELIQGSRIAGSVASTTLSATSFRLVIGQAGGVSASGNDFTVLGTTGAAADTLDILVYPYTSRSNISNSVTSTAFAVLDTAGEQLFFELGDGYEDVEFVEVSLNDARDAALLTVLRDNGRVESALLTGDDFAVSRNGQVIRMLGAPDNFSPVTGNEQLLEAEFGDYRDAIDAILASRT